MRICICHPAHAFSACQWQCFIPSLGPSSSPDHSKSTMDRRTLVTDRSGLRPSRGNQSNMQSNSQSKPSAFRTPPQFPHLTGARITPRSVFGVLTQPPLLVKTNNNNNRRRTVVRQIGLSFRTAARAFIVDSTILQMAVINVTLRFPSSIVNTHR